MKMDKHIIEQIEQFYAEMEKMDKKYNRPVDYIERSLRVIERKHNPAYPDINEGY